MAGPGKVAFTADAARRIASATLAHERGNRDMPPIRFRQGGGEEDGVRLGRISATWTKGSTASVDELDAEGELLSPAVSFTAKNWFATVTVPSGEYRKVACALSRGTWILIAAEC
jgi:hypothetical protein